MLAAGVRQCSTAFLLVLQCSRRSGARPARHVLCITLTRLTRTRSCGMPHYAVWCLSLAADISGSAAAAAAAALHSGIPAGCTCRVLCQYVAARTRQSCDVHGPMLYAEAIAAVLDGVSLQTA